MKIVGDGVVENHKAYFFEPYLDVKSNGAMNSGDRVELEGERKQQP